ncbi:MAG: carboxymuconolactone decarboxylase family protein [Hyphomicrobiales bacterium]
MSRLPKATREQFPDDLKYVWDAVARDQATGGDGGTPPNIFRAMGNNPALLRGYLRLGNTLWNHCGLDLPTRELVILRTAILHQSEYEWHQHVRIGRGAGLTNEQINALHRWRQSDLFSEPQRAIFAYVDAVNASDHPLDEVHAALEKHFDPGTIVGINILTGFYAMTAKFLGAMEVQTENAFVGWNV